jgi:hypothetical protein
MEVSLVYMFYQRLAAIIIKIRMQLKKEII